MLIEYSTLRHCFLFSHLVKHSSVTANEQRWEIQKFGQNMALLYFPMGDKNIWTEFFKAIGKIKIFDVF